MDTALANATVQFNQQQKYSNVNGFVSIVAPRVLPDENNTYSVIAFKERLSAVAVNSQSSISLNY